MKSFAALVINIGGLVINVVFSILNLIHGWGLQPKSWLFILLITPSAAIISILLHTLADALRKAEK